jgi:hypothetical protein
VMPSERAYSGPKVLPVRRCVRVVRAGLEVRRREDEPYNDRSSEEAHRGQEDREESDSSHGTD